MNLEPQKKVLLNLKDLIEKLDPQSFTQKNKTLFGASIGEHFRLIVEFYSCCLSPSFDAEVNYDLRRRDKKLELDIQEGISTIDQILKTLHLLKEKDDKILLLNNCLESEKEDSKNKIQTSFFRELTYCMDHCIHHQSLIKIALLEQELTHLVDENFGVAFSTQKHRNQCA